MRSRLTYANVVSTVCLFIVLGGSAYAAARVTGGDVQNGSLTGADVKTNSLNGTDIEDLRGPDIDVDAIDSDEIRDGSIRLFDLAADARAGMKGDKGDTGAAGPKGDTGPAGAKGDRGLPGEDGTDGTNGSVGTVTVRTNSSSHGGATTGGPAQRPAVVASCLPGERATGGSAVSSEEHNNALASRPSPSTAGQTPTGWESLNRGQPYADETVTVYVVCVA